MLTNVRLIVTRRIVVNRRIGGSSWTAHMRVGLASGFALAIMLSASTGVWAQTPSSGYDQSGGYPSGEDMSDPYSSGSYDSDPYSMGAVGQAKGPDVKQAIDGGILNALGQFDFVSLIKPSAGPTLPSGPILLTQAEEAFAKGHQQLALDMYFGHMVAEFEDAGAAFKAIKYSPLLRRPVWQMRWGVSISARLDGVTDPKPLTAESRPGGGFDNGDYDTGGSDPGFDSGYDSGEMDPREAQLRAAMMRDGNGMRGGPPGAGAPIAPVIPQVNVSEILEKNLGVVAKLVADEFSKRFQSGAFGSALPSLKPPLVEIPAAANAFAAGNANGYDDMSGYDDDMYEGSMDSEGMNNAYGDPSGRGPGAQALQPPPSIGPPQLLPPSSALPMWVPGIVFVGEGPSTETLVKAKEAGIELLIHFDMVAKAAGRNGEVQNISRCRVFRVSTGKPMISSKGIDTNEAQNFLRAGRTTNTDYATGQMLTVWTIIDRDATAIALPQLSPEVAKKRVGSIVTAPPKERLQTLAEIRMYEAAGLLQPADVALAFDLVGGDKAMELLYGPVEERREIVREWATE